MKVVSVVGARPNFIKLASLNPLLEEGFEHIIVHTGQHYDYELSRIFFENLEIPEPDHYLGVGSGSHGYQVGEMVKRVEEVLVEEKPSLVLVYGDTNSTLAGALAAVKAGFKVAHVEAGLRSYDMRMPEEVNRRVVDHISHLLFAPTPTAISNLKAEAVLGEAFLTGDVHVDILRRWLKVAESSRILSRLGLKEKDYTVVTVHRAENVDDSTRLASIVEGLTSLRKQLVFPVHPRTRKALMRYGLYGKISSSNVILTEPLGYLDFIKLLKYAELAVTDSGGVQREAFLLGVPCLVLRDRTEWIELVESGWVKLVPDPLRLSSLVRSFEKPKARLPLLGNGRAAERIVQIIREKLGRKHA